MPVATTSALVMVVCGKDSVARLSQLPAKQGAANSASPAAVRTLKLRFGVRPDKRQIDISQAGSKRKVY